MAIGMYVGVGGKARRIKVAYVGDSNGKARKIVKGYVGVNEILVPEVSGDISSATEDTSGIPDMVRDGLPLFLNSEPIFTNNVANNQYVNCGSSQDIILKIFNAGENAYGFCSYVSLSSDDWKKENSNWTKITNVVKTSDTTYTYNFTPYKLKRKPPVLGEPSVARKFFGASLISFTISFEPYQAEEGMTWGEWCNSPYNTDGYIISDLDWIMNSYGDIVLSPGSDEYALSSDTIIPNCDYEVEFAF